MGDKEKNSSTEDGSKSEETTRESDNKVDTNDDAGPSGAMALPGAVQTPKTSFTTKPGISKSEHSIRHIITSKDVTNALKSLNFGAPTQAIKNLNLKELKIPILSNDTVDRDDSTTLIDLKNFMASCFKLNKEPGSAIALNELPRPNMQTVVSSVAIDIPNPPSVSCVTNNIQTEIIPVKANEVIVTRTVEPKMLKTDKKKTSGSLSERSDLGIAQRDSLSSIGSNVCRICMTRGRERLISPCNCKGSLANVHLSCLERWLNQVGRNHCELCGFSYPAIRTPRYTVLQALRLWFGNPRNRSHLQVSDCEIVFSQYAQDPYELYTDLLRNEDNHVQICAEQSKTKKTKDRRQTKIIKKDTSTKSFVMNRLQRRGIKLIKISVIDLCNNYQNDSDSDSENVILCAQYVVKDAIDSIMDDTEGLVKKISKSLVDTEF